MSRKWTHVFILAGLARLARQAGTLPKSHLNGFEADGGMCSSANGTRIATLWGTGFENNNIATLLGDSIFQKLSLFNLVLGCGQPPARYDSNA